MPSPARRILQVDADAFYVQVARLIDPDGAGRAELLLVGGSPEGRGVVTSASYAARRFGARSGMSMAQAIRLCPDALVVRVPRRACAERSRGIVRVLDRFSPVVEPASIDEMYVDLTGTEGLYRHEPLEVTARRIRDAVRQETEITVSIGGGTNRLVAKLAASRAKPHRTPEASGVLVVAPGEEGAFLATFDLADIPGVGPRFQERLEALGLRTVPDALGCDRATLRHWLGARAADWLMERIRGVHSAPVRARPRAKSLSRDETFATDLDDDAALRRELLRLADRAAADLRAHGYRARTVSVRIRDRDFRDRRASRTVPEPLSADRPIGELALALFAKLRAARRIPARLLSVSLSHSRKIRWRCRKRSSPWNPSGWNPSATADSPAPWTGPASDSGGGRSSAVRTETRPRFRRPVPRSILLGRPLILIKERLPMRWIPLAVALAYLAPAPAAAQIDARMFRYPDISATHITFVYAGDIWVVPKTGGTAHRLSSPPGEEAFPRFSPDGTRIAFSASYDGNTDVYVVPTMGGEPVRITHHPMGDRLVDWHPDGRLLFASSRESGRQRYSQFYLVSASGGLPTKLPVPYGEFGSFNADGRLFAYVPMSQDFRTWKRYRGGWSPDIWIFDLRDSSATKIAPHDADDTQPMWHGNLLYFLSDRGPELRHNLWAFDRATGAVRQVTRFRDFDITFPAAGPEDIVFQAGGRLYTMSFAGEQVREVKVDVVTDRLTLKPRAERVTSRITTAGVSPTGQRAVFEARGEIFTVPAEHGPVLNLTRTSGIVERYPSWSPDAQRLAYWTDRSGEYELVIRNADGSGAERKLTSLGEGYRYTAHWSPDNKKLVFVDEAMRVRLYDLDRQRATQIDQSPMWMGHGALQGLRFTWSADGRWIAFARPTATGNPAVFLYDTREAKLHQATSGYSSDAQPVFDPDGKYLYYLSNRNFEPVYGDFDNSWTYPNATHVVAVPLRADLPSPLSQRNDAEKGQEAQKGQEGQKSDTTGPAAVNIDLTGFEARAVVLPPKPGNYTALQAAKGKVVYRRLPRTGSGDDKSPVVYYDLEEREEKTVLDDADSFTLTYDGKKLLAVNNRRFSIVELKPGQKLDKMLRTDEMETVVDPRAEWRQMFADAYRFERDFFYDPTMHGVDWKGLRDRYGRLLEDAVTRWDVNFVLGEFIAELNASHTYRGGGDEESAPSRGVGMLGVDWALENGAYRITRIVQGGPWDADARSPLREPGVDVKEGDYVLAVNGVPLDTSRDPWAAFQGLSGAPVVLTVNARPSAEGARQVVTKTLSDETELRFRAWIEERRQRVDAATGGRVGYIYVQSTGVGAQSELVRQFMAQWRKDGLIIDERWNSGGQIPDRFVELLNRPMLSYWAVRHGQDWQWPPVAHRGPKVMLINGWSGSGGDAFPFYFREAKIGPLIGTRTWGGLIGISGAPSIADGGQLTVPTFRMYDVQGNWFPEGHGVEPDILVEENPAQLARGTDPQLERAIEEVMRRIREAPPAPPKRPRYEDRTVASGPGRD